MKPVRWVILGLVAAALALFGWWLHHTYHFVKDSRWQGYQGEAATNDFLAAQRLVQRMGHPATCIRGVPEPGRLPPVGDTLILPRRSIPMTNGQAEALADWVEKGGTLIAEGLEAEPEDAKETKDALFAAFGARLALSTPQGKDPVLACKLDDQSMKVYTGNRYRILDIDGEVKSWAGEEDDRRILQYDSGKGRCYLITNMAWLQNGHIADWDHADFLAGLALRPQETSRVWIVAWEEPLSLLRWLAHHALPILLSLAFLGIFLLWAAAPRFGPPVADPEPGRRRFLEHLDASGRYLWRKQEGRPLLQACRDAFHRRLGQVHPAWTHLHPDELCVRLAAHAGLPEDAVFRALRYETTTDAAGFLEAVQTLELLRKKL